MPLVLNSSSISGLAPVGGLSSPQTGSVLQVVSNTVTASASTSSGTYGDMGTFSASITPTSATSKILVSFATGHVQGSASSLAAAYRLVRDSTELIIFAQSGHFLNLSGISEFNPGGLAIDYLDSPATTSSITYKPQFRIRFGTGTTSIEARSITLMEIAA